MAVPGFRWDLLRKRILFAEFVVPVPYMYIDQPKSQATYPLPCIPRYLTKSHRSMPYCQQSRRGPKACGSRELLCGQRLLGLLSP